MLSFMETWNRQISLTFLPFFIRMSGCCMTYYYMTAWSKGGVIYINEKFSVYNVPPMIEEKQTISEPNWYSFVWKTSDVSY